jgi:hypothetical protein
MSSKAFRLRGKGKRIRKEYKRGESKRSKTKIRKKLEKGVKHHGEAPHFALDEKSKITWVL